MTEVEKARKAYHAALRERAKTLRAELAEIESVLGTKRAFASRTSPCKNPENETIWNICRGAMEQRGIMTAEELLEVLEKAGEPLYGKNLPANLRNRLRMSPDFRYERGLGWSLTHA